MCFAKRSYAKVLQSLFEFILELNSEHKSDSYTFNGICGDTFFSIVVEVEQTVNNSSTLLSLGSSLEELTNCAETLSIAVILMGIIRSLMKHKMNISNKKIKRKKEANASNAVENDSILCSYNSMASKFEECTLKIQTIIKSIDVLPIINAHSFSLTDLSVSFMLSVNI